MADRQAAGGAGRNVDVVVADGHLADHAQARGGVQQGGIDPVGEQAEQAISAGRPLAQDVVGRRQLVLPQIDRAGVAEQGQPLLRDGAGDEDSRAGHGVSPWRV